MTVAIAIWLFIYFRQFTLAMVISGDFESYLAKIPVMVNVHYIHFYKNKNNKSIPTLLIHLFRPPMQAWVNRTTCSVYRETGLFTPTCFAVAAPHSELKATRTFTVMDENFSPCALKSYGLE